MTTQQDVKTRLKTFALRIIRMYVKLPKTDAVAQVLGKQVLRSGTSAGAIFCEAYRARSPAEFSSKTGESLMELEETAYWLDLIVESGTVPMKKMEDLLSETNQLIAILTTINKKTKMVLKHER